MESPWTLLGVAFPVGVIIFLSTLRYSECQIDKNFNALNAEAEEIYIVGYSFTLAALLGVALHTGLDPSALIRIAAIKVLTALAGLMAMIILKREALKWESETEKQVSIAQSEVHYRVKHFQESLDSLENTISSVNKIVDIDYLLVFNEQSQIASEQVRKLGEVTRDTHALLGNGFSKFQKSMSSMSEGSETMRDRFNELNQGVFTLSESVTKAHSELNHFIESSKNDIYSLPQNLKAIKSAADSLASNISTVNEQHLITARRFKAAAKQIESLGTSSVESVSALSQIPEAISKYHEMFDKMQKTLSSVTGLIETITTANPESIADLTKTAQEAVSESTGQISKSNVSVVSLTNAVDQFSETISTLTNDLSDLEPSINKLQKVLVTTESAIKQIPELVSDLKVQKSANEANIDRIKELEEEMTSMNHYVNSNENKSLFGSIFRNSKD